MTKTPFSLTEIHAATRVVLRACGRLTFGDGADDPLWAAHLERAHTADVELDLSCVQQVDARGLGVLATLAQRTVEHGRRVSIVAASRVVQRLGRLAGLDRVMAGNWDTPATAPDCLSRCGL
jgi:anti-anti-sigma factor